MAAPDEAAEAALEVAEAEPDIEPVAEPEADFEAEAEALRCSARGDALSGVITHDAPPEPTQDVSEPAWMITGEEYAMVPPLSVILMVLQTRDQYGRLSPSPSHSHVGASGKVDLPSHG